MKKVDYEIKIDLTLDEDPFGIRERGKQNPHGININRNVDDDPFGMRKRGRKGGPNITNNLNHDDDPFGLRKRATNHDDDPFGLRNRPTNHDDDPFKLRNRPQIRVHGLKRNEFQSDFNYGQQGFGHPDTCVYDQEECNAEEYIGVGMIVDTLEECEFLYNAHAKITGFSIRRRRNSKGVVTRRRWVCAKEGHRPTDDFEGIDRRREPRSITRVGCLASFVVQLDKTLKKYVVKHFNVGHNHSLEQLHDTQFLRSHRSVGLADDAQIKGLLSVGVKPAQIMDYFVKQSGGYKYVGFTAKDLANCIRVIRRGVLKVGDAQSTLTYLQGKQDSDPMFFYSYDEDDKKRLTNLFWADGRSRADYASFGDVIAFDSTYKTNAYRKPLVIFVGVNNHHQSTIFGFALLVDETVKTYCWVLNTFLATMGNKMPVSVLTDGDKAMRNAIQNCFPGTTHRLCSWHLHNNSMTHVKAEHGFCREFQICMATWYTREEFDAAWKDIVVRYKLQNNEWVADTYANRELWAEAYLRGVFFAGMRSTQRCEGMNSYLNRFVHTQLKMFEVVRQIERGNGRIRQKAALAAFESTHGSQVLTTALQSLEKHGEEIYTKQSFKKFRNELKHESLYSVVDKAKNAAGVTYLLGKYCDIDSNNVVTYEKTNSKLQCSCQRFESNGIPCRHMLAVVKAENMETIPECCITRRWCKDAKSEMGESVGETVPEDVATSVRYGALSAACNNLSYLASQSRNVFEVVRTEINGLTRQITGVSEPTSNMNGNEIGSKCRANREVEDPVIVKTKGRPGGDGKNIVKRARKCGTCRNIGHNRTHCPHLGKPPKIRKAKKVKEIYEQTIAADLDSDTDKEAWEDQWEYSTMPSPEHNCTKNITISNSARGPIYYGSSSFPNRAG